MWRQALTVAAADLIVLSEQADPQQLSMLRINPLTAALLLTEYVELGKDDWVIQNGGNSGVGRSVIAFAQEFGLRSVSLVRRPELVDELKSAGADVVLVDGPDVVKQVAAATGKAKIKLGIDGVGGDASHSVASCLTSNAKMVAYGGVSGKPAAMSPLNIIFKQVTLRPSARKEARGRHQGQESTPHPAVRPGPPERRVCAPTLVIRPSARRRQGSTLKSHSWPRRRIGMSIRERTFAADSAAH